ncbi:Lipopolysaccharide-induced tumor necrosis factor-alpha factor [Armadillidium nasatum]|uniref:Lipopolysaccharide-induced tumor necrosis factor-alpha factor n=1 Tax=Armadillidium nasatum TaxID=96803 RepID=A0A5N5TLI6_9CRUS|nr:Lipopolysaccharide-induced tumor necrosis factor-alpha factor [Armadillidium nasatum]
MSNPVEDFVLDENSKVGRRDDDVIFTLQAKGNNNNAPSIGKFFEGDNERLLPKEPMKSSRTKMTCPRCQTEMMSKTKNENSIATYLFCCLICVTGGSACCCCFLPFCMNSCKKVQHNCSRCDQYLGHYYPR